MRAARNAAQRLYDTAAGIERLTAQSDVVAARIAQLASRLDVFSLELEGLGSRLDALERSAGEDRQTVLDAIISDHAETVEMLHVIRNDEPANRQRLWRLRDTAEYVSAFEEAEPLVSFCMATYNNTDLLLERALPSVLAQTYERIEVVIVGDAAAPEVERRIKAVGDPRIRYENMSLRGPYPERGEGMWLVAGAPPSNEAMRLARGRWLASMDDDDESTPDRAERLLKAARERQLEFCYGQLEQHEPDGSTVPLCEFPPQLHKVGLQASLMHAGLRFICAELSDSLFRTPGDWSRISRMMRLGVRIGMIDDVVVHYYPGWYRRGGPA